jgi:hypothetical protein
MISDKYQGVIVYRVLKDLIRKRELFRGMSSPKFDKFEAFSTGRLSIMEGWYVVSNSILRVLKIKLCRKIIDSYRVFLSSQLYDSVCVKYIDTFVD